MLLSDQVRDNEVVKVRFDGPHNRLRIEPNHEGIVEDVDPEYFEDSDGMDVEEMD